MSTVPSYFKDFLSNIRLSDNQVKDLKTGHTTLRKRLEEDETLSKIIISTRGCMKERSPLRSTGRSFGVPL